MAYVLEAAPFLELGFLADESSVSAAASGSNGQVVSEGRWTWGPKRLTAKAKGRGKRKREHSETRSERGSDIGEPNRPSLSFQVLLPISAAGIFKFFFVLFGGSVSLLRCYTLKTTTRHLHLPQGIRRLLSSDAEKRLGLGVVVRDAGNVMETVNLLVRTAIIDSTFRKAPRVTTMMFISTDSTRLWMSPIQAVIRDNTANGGLADIIGVALLINNLGYSALVGLGVLLSGFPLQMLLERMMFAQRKKGVKITDTCARLSNEVLQGIRLIEYYAWESFYIHRIGSLGERKIAAARKTT
ncbi:hypothetical protein C8R45DRAFT_939478 [Mycena sanguinolenta]|nr:hypothetical protein C8R45DRAFT_939478 [Mycena sanguinolenta]